jgi:ribosomal protein bL25 (Ctc-form)
MKFVAYERTQQGTGASRRLRLTNKVPGIVYGSGTPQMIELDHNALYFALKKETFHSSILEMELGGKTEKVLLRDFQMHAWKQNVLHIDFQRVDETTRITKRVPHTTVRGVPSSRSQASATRAAPSWKASLSIPMLTSTGTRRTRKSRRHSTRPPAERDR